MKNSAIYIIYKIRRLRPAIGEFYPLLNVSRALQGEDGDSPFLAAKYPSVKGSGVNVCDSQEFNTTVFNSNKCRPYNIISPVQSGAPTGSLRCFANATSVYHLIFSGNLRGGYRRSVKTRILVNYMTPIRLHSWIC